MSTDLEYLVRSPFDGHKPGDVLKTASLEAQQLNFVVARVAHKGVDKPAPKKQEPQKTVQPIQVDQENPK